jgi:hypothetical protein
MSQIQLRALKFRESLNARGARELGFNYLKYRGCQVWRQLK